MGPSASADWPWGRNEIEFKEGIQLSKRFLGYAVLLVPLWGTACVERDLSLPTAEDVVAAYNYSGSLEAELSGNVVVVTVVQPYSQLRRGGSIWAKVGPYVLLFTEETRDLFVGYGGLAAVRVITTTSSGQQIARATLLRDGLNELTWRRALNISGIARRDGSTKVPTLEDLIEWGEDHTEFEYDPRYIRRR